MGTDVTSLDLFHRLHSRKGVVGMLWNQEALAEFWVL